MSNILGAASSTSSPYFYSFMSPHIMLRLFSLSLRLCSYAATARGKIVFSFYNYREDQNRDRTLENSWRTQEKHCVATRRRRTLLRRRSRDFLLVRSIWTHPSVCVCERKRERPERSRSIRAESRQMSRDCRPQSQDIFLEACLTMNTNISGLDVEDLVLFLIAQIKATMIPNVH